MQWYYALNDQRRGPVAPSDFEKLVAEGTIRPDTLVWHEGMANWQAYSAIAAGGAAAATDANDDTAICAVSGKRYPKREMIQYEGQWISAEHRDAYFQRLREGVALPGVGAVPGPYGYGGFWRRFLAFAVDSILLWVVMVVLSMFLVPFIGNWLSHNPSRPGLPIVSMLVFYTFGLAFWFGYHIFFIRKYDATVGKLAMGIKIVRSDGGKLGVGRIVGRAFSYMLSGFFFYIGFIIAGFDRQKRALHDHICDTRVIKTRA